MCIGVDDTDDVDRVADQLTRIDVDCQREPMSLTACDTPTGIRATLQVLPRLSEPSRAPAPLNGPGRIERANDRAPGVLRDGPLRPRRLGHVVVGSVDVASSQRFFVRGLGFKVSDQVGDFACFMRCSTDHHNLLLQSSPVTFLHHSSWEVDDVDEVGRGAMRMLEGHPERHVWGLGRHFIGSNFFWYLRDPAGNFSEYYSDMDTIIDDQLWKPGTFEPSLRTLYAWGPDVPASMLEPEDLAELMTTSHHP
jgi:hypothetical protein